MKIEFGAGDSPQYPKYKKCDIRDLEGIDYVCNAWEIDNLVEENTVDHIYSRHFLEHLTFEQARVYFSACYKILKEGSVMEHVLPNMEWHVRQWLSEDNAMGFNIDEPFIRGINGLWGKQRGELSDLWDVHKSGYKPWQIEKMLSNAEFSEIEWIDTPVKNLHFKAYK